MCNDVDKKWYAKGDIFAGYTHREGAGTVTMTTISAIWL